MSSSTIIGIPTDEKVFESNCVPLFAGLLKDPNVKLVGSRGQKQFGLDLIGRRDRDPAQPVGIQCKLITRGGKLTEKVVRSEVSQALMVRPALTEFYIVTTANDETSHDLLAIELAQGQATLGRSIDIQIWGWDTLQDKIRADPRALAAFDPDYSASTSRLLELGDETVAGQAQLLAHSESVLHRLDIISASISGGPSDTERSTFEQHLDAQVDQYRGLVNAGKPRTAVKLFEELEKALSPSSSNAIRARIKANIAIARLRLGDDETGAALLTEAYDLNPSDPRTRANKILALALEGDLDGAWAFAKKVLVENPSNAAAAGLAFQVAALSTVQRDPLEIVPEAVLDDLHVRIQRISYLRTSPPSDSWRELAADTLKRFPDDRNAIRMAGDALVDAALDGKLLERRGVIPAARLTKLRAGIDLLQGLWDQVRLFEDAAEPTWLMVAQNLITAHRAVGDLTQAARVSEQMLALGSSDPDTFLTAAWVAIDRDAYAEAAELLRKGPLGSNTLVPLLVALSNLQDWKGVLTEATDERRNSLPHEDKQLFDVLVFRAMVADNPSADLDDIVAKLLERWPLGVAAHIAVADIYRTARPDLLPAMAEKAKSLITTQTSISDRVMFAQLALFREKWEDIIFALEGHVGPDRPSEQLAWLAYAYANAPTRPATAAFFRSLDPEIIALPRYARLAGAAEHNRGDLKAAERYLRKAIEADPQDLRAVLLLASTIMRDNRENDALRILTSVDDEKVDGSPEDLMRLAHRHRKAGEVERALRLGYKVAASNRQNENVVSGYPALIFLDEALPPPIGLAGPAQRDFWFDLEGLDGTRDIAGVIDDLEIAGVPTFGSTHALASKITGRSVGDIVEMSAEFGADRRYRVRELKHKYIWLLHDIMATHAARFPEARSMFEMTMKDNDVQPVLDVVRSLQTKDDVVATTYAESSVPLSAIAAIGHRPVLGLAEHLTMTGTNLRTCVGTLDERKEAIDFVRRARGMGVVLDTLTVWQLREFGHLPATKAYFGQICIPRSTFDEIIELRAHVESHRGREYMTMGFDGDQAWRQMHSAEDTEARLAAVNQIISDLEQYCETLPVDGSEDTRLDNLMGSYAARKVFDPINLARSQGMILLSEDLNLRQYAAQQGVVGGAWLQVALHVMAADGCISESDYLTAVGLLGVLRHDHVWLDAPTMRGILTLDDPRALHLFEAAIRFMGGPTADMPSHISVTLDLMRSIWSSALPRWQKGRAVGKLLEQLVRSRPQDWKVVLHVLDAELATPAHRGHIASQLARDYLADWIIGHFFDLTAIRSAERVRAELNLQLPARSRRRRKRRD